MQRSAAPSAPLRVALINAARANTAFAERLRTRAQRTLQVAKDCGADVILPGAASVGVVAIVARRELRSEADVDVAAKRLNGLQERFEAKVGFVIVDRVDSQAQADAVLELQQRLDPEGLILSIVYTLDQAVQQVEKLAASLADRTKRRLQSEYCARVAAEASAPGAGLRMVCAYLAENFGISAVDCDLLSVTFPTLQRLVSASPETILETCPVERSTVEALQKVLQLR